MSSGSMQKGRNGIILVLLLVLAGWSVYREYARKDPAAATSSETAPKVGYQAPAFLLKDSEGGSYAVDGSRDKPVLLNFWASWCGPCKEEAPVLARLYEKYKDKLDFYAVNLTGNDETDAALAFAQRYKYTFPVLLDQELKVSGLYGVKAIPTSFLIDRNGVIVDVVNLMAPEELDRKLRKLAGG